MSVCIASIIIPVFNQVEYTEACLNAIEATCAHLNYEVIVVNNGSTDRTYELLESKKLSFPQLQVIHKNENLGYSPANNLGAASACGEFLILLNNDTIPQGLWLDNLIKIAQRPDVGVVGPKLLYPETFLVNHVGYLYCARLGGFFARYHGALSNLPFIDKERELQALLGACLCVRRDMFNSIGGLEVFGLEDIDFCLRIKKFNKKIIYTPSSTVLHHGSITIRFSESRSVPDMNNHSFNERWPKEKFEDDYLRFFLEDGIGVDYFSDDIFTKPFTDVIKASYDLAIIGMEHKMSNAFEAALKAFKDAFYIYKYNTDAAIELVILYCEKEDIKSATSTAREALNFSPENSTLIHLLKTLDRV